ncbi:hypothetical protein PR048_010277 [Dryococelus australis]|uniref:PiggyBac transposable element-derived protein domain-containing protein n=1 Tax=Dryococelus australis TaxID=614101 RepID=A0ABQ9I4A4_9NEOP|nr:hypothetical protein PR048_010277 [Dryococelus australis]
MKLKETLQVLEKKGVILVIVRKPSGMLRKCLNPQDFNPLKPTGNFICHNQTSFFGGASLEDDDEEEISRSVAVSPPDEAPGADSDEDSDNSDGEAQGNLDRLLGRVLRSQYFNTEATRNNGGFISSTTTKACFPEAVKWLPHDKLFSSKLPEQDCPVDAFTCFFTHDLVSLIVEETNRYAGQHLVNNLNVPSNESLTVIGVMRLSGYHSLPHKRMYWQTQPDVHVSIVAEDMRRNRFDEIVRYLHIADNAAMDGTDRMYKVLPLFDHLNSALKQISIGDSAYMRLLIPGAIFFILNHTVVHLHDFRPQVMGKEMDVVMGLVDHLQLKKGTGLYFDNYFTSFSLLRNLKSNGIGATGTQRE